MQRLGNPFRSAPAAAATATLVVALGCADQSITAPMVGELSVHVATSGTDIDPDGYLIVVTESPAHSVGANGAVTFRGISAGPHLVELQDLSRNCSVQGDNPRTVEVPAGDSASTTFLVECLPLVGDLMVITSTDGVDVDPDGYTVVVDGGHHESVDSSGDVTLRDLPEGDRTVELDGVPANCVVTGDNPRIVSVGFGETVSTSFQVSCARNVGSLEIVVSSAGDDVDPHGYFVIVDGTIQLPAKANDTIAVLDLAAGDHTVKVVGIEANCAVVGNNPRTLQVPFGETATTTFDVNCVRNVGHLEVVTATGGNGLDPDGYLIVLNGTLQQAAGTNDAVMFRDLVPGGHTVELTEVAPNCSVAGDNPRVLSVPFGEAASTAFHVECERWGELVVVTSASGVDLPSMLTVTVSGVSSRAIAPNGSVAFGELPPGSYTVTLSEMPSNCQSVNGPTSRQVTLSGTLVSVAFDLRCAELRLGSLVFDSDRNGRWDIFLMRSDGSNQTNLTNHPANDRNAVVSPGGSRIAFHSDRNGTDNIYVMNLDGSGLVQLTSMSRAMEPYWSPDGSKLVFTGRVGGQWDIWLMNADGSSRVNLTNHPGSDGRAEWSPDGSKLVFDSRRDGARGIFVMNPDGTGVERITSGNDWNPTWSRDGSRIAFTRFNANGVQDIWLMNADGSHQMNLTNRPTSMDGEAAFSPDGTSIAFASARFGKIDIFIMSLNGAEIRQLTHDVGNNMWPSWSP